MLNLRIHVNGGDPVETSDGRFSTVHDLEEFVTNEITRPCWTRFGHWVGFSQNVTGIEVIG